MKHFVTVLVLACVLYSGKSYAGNDEPVIIYGGVGNLGRGAQPCLATFYETKGKQFNSYTSAINTHIRAVLNRVTLLPKSGSVIIDSTTLNQAIRKSGIEFINRPTQTDIQEFLEDNEEQLLTLAIVGTVEAYVQNPKETSKGTLFEEHFIIGVSAVLVQAAGDNSGQIVSTGSALTEVINERADRFSAAVGKLCIGEKNMSPVALKKVAIAYQDAAERAIINMSKVHKLSDGDSDSVIVTGVSVGSDKLQKLFNINTANIGARESICDQPALCSDDDQECQSLVALLAFGVTDAFSSRGYLAVPPLNWRSWGKTAEYQTTKNVKLTGGRQDIVKFINVNVGPNSADRKLLPTVTKFAEIVKQVKGKPWHRRLYMGWMKVPWEETEFDNCKSVENQGVVATAKKSYGPVSQLLVTGKYIKSEPPLNVRKFHYMAAMMRALGGLKKSLKPAD